MSRATRSMSSNTAAGSDGPGNRRKKQAPGVFIESMFERSKVPGSMALATEYCGVLVTGFRRWKMFMSPKVSPLRWNDAKRSAPLNRPLPRASTLIARISFSSASATTSVMPWLWRGVSRSRCAGRCSLRAPEDMRDGTMESSASATIGSPPDPGQLSLVRAESTFISAATAAPVGAASSSTTSISTGADPSKARGRCVGTDGSALPTTRAPPLGKSAPNASSNSPSGISVDRSSGRGSRRPRQASQSPCMMTRAISRPPPIRM